MNNAETAVTLSESAQALLKNLNEMLNEEKWTRASLGNYSTNQFKELDAILKTARDEKVVNELKKRLRRAFSSHKKQFNRALPVRHDSPLPPNYRRLRYDQPCINIFGQS